MFLPSKIGLEASSHCQLKCPACPTADGSITAGIAKGVLRPEDFRRLLDENRWIREVELSNYGEIFLNPRLVEILENADDRNVHLTARNGVNLNHVRPEVLEAVVKYRVRAMTCSIDGASAETYAKYRVGGDFDRVIANIRAINTAKKKYDSPCPALTWQFVVFGHNEHELQKAREMATSLDMAFRPKLSWDPDFSPVRDEAAVSAELILGAASRAQFEEKTGTVYSSRFCHHLWDAPRLNWDGTLLGCCRNFWGDFGPNAYEHGLVAVLKGEKMQYAKAMLQGKAAPRDDIPCTTCDAYHAIVKRKAWLRRGPTSRAGLGTLLCSLDRISGLKRLRQILGR